ncbi:MAG: metal-dependent hydrolase [Bdellovibrionales bacterium]|nr:metal-dependent hydrolase [Bdellovibrionales bacterium]
MATVFTHSFVGYTLSQLAPESVRKNRKFIFWMCFLPIIPDFDYLGWVLHVPYGGVWGHRGLTHSILFSFALSALALAKMGKPYQINIACFLGISAVSHGVLDAMTNGGLGVAFFSPYSLARYFFSWRPIEVSPIGIRFFSWRGLVVIINEMQWIWTPCLILLLARSAITRQLLSFEKGRIK